MVIIGLIKKDVFAIFNRIADSVLLKHAVGVDTVFLAELLPKLESDLVSALSDLNGYDFPRHLIP